MSRITIATLLSSALALVAPHPALATQPVTLGEVVVTAATLSEPVETGDVDRELTPAFVTVVEREAFEGKVEDLGQVLEKEAAVQVRQSGGAGSFSSISIRGSSSDQVLVYLDGILLNDAAGGGVDLSSLSLSDVGALEIYKGVTPIQFSQASLGGAVNLRTLRREPGFNASLSGGYGSFDTRKLTGLINHKLGRWDYLVAAEHLTSDNDYPIVNDNGTRWNPNDDRTEDRNNAELAQTNLLTKVGGDLTDSLRLALLNQWFHKDQGLPARTNSPDTDTSLETTRNITTLVLSAEGVTGLDLSTRTTLDLLVKHEVYDDSEGDVGLGSQELAYHTHRYGGSFFTEWFGESHLIAVHADLHRETYRSEDLLDDTPEQESARNTLTLAVQDTWLLADDALALTPALRYAHVRDHLDTTGDAALGRRTRDHFEPQAGLRWQLTPALSLKANLARSVREPSFFELFGDRGHFLGNADLKAEKALNGDLGFEVRQRFSGPLLTALRGSAAYFATRAEDLITRVYDARGIGQSVNISEARISGVEATAAADLLGFFTLSGNATWQDTENRNAIGAFDGKQLPGRWRRSYLGRADARLGEFSVFFEYVAERGLYYDTANLLEAEDKNITNAGLTWLHGPLRLSFQANNLGDDRHEDLSGYPLPGRHYFVNLKLYF